MSNLSKREKILLLVLFVIVFCFLYYEYAATPILERLNNTRAVFDNNIKILRNLEESSNNIDKIRKQSEELNSQLSEFVKIVPNSSRIPEIIMDIKNMTDSSGCTGIRMYFGDINNNNANTQNNQADKNSKAQNNGEVLTLIPIGYEVSGDFNSIMSLLSKLESSSRKLNIDKVSVVKDEKTGMLSANININCYFLKKAGELNQIDYPFTNSAAGKYNIFN